MRSMDGDLLRRIASVPHDRAAARWGGGVPPESVPSARGESGMALPIPTWQSHGRPHLVDGQRRCVGAVMRIAAALAATVALATGAVATVIPGGGPERSACYVVLDVAGTRALRTARILECVDGDPSCDLDGLCNDQCEFGLRVCINQPGLAGCTPPRALDRIGLRYRPPTVTLRPPAVLEGPVCGDPVGARVAVIQRPNVACTSDVCSGRKRPGRARVTASATGVRGTGPRFDRDSYLLRCLPRVPPCPPTTTTSTSTTSRS